MKHITHILSLSAILVLICTKSFAETPLTFNQAWIAEAPPVSRVLAAYMEILNGSDKTVIISAIESDDFTKIEFHRTIHENNIAKMIHQESLSIPAQGTLKLEQGSYHLMLFNPVKKFSAGDNSTFTISTSDNQQYKLSVTVKKSGMPEHHHHH